MNIEKETIVFVSEIREVVYLLGMCEFFVRSRCSAGNQSRAFCLSVVYSLLAFLYSGFALVEQRRAECLARRRGVGLVLC